MSEREFVDYQGERFWLQSKGAYFQSGDKGAPERLLHRRIYIDNFGPIPPGFDVHHADEDWRNNGPENLEALPQADHRRHHMAERWRNAASREVMAAGLEKAREAAKAWHASPAGLAWHSANGVASWEDREPTRRACDRCGKTYDAWVENSRFCSRTCIAANANAGRFSLAAKCPVCSVDFMANRYRPVGTCSRQCAAVLRRKA